MYGKATLELTEEEIKTIISKEILSKYGMVWSIDSNGIVFQYESKDDKSKVKFLSGVKITMHSGSKDK